MNAEAALREQVVGVCRRLYDRGLIAGAEGNVSVRIGPGRILITPAGLPKADLLPSQLVAVTEAGGVEMPGTRPSTEIAMHLRIFRRRPEVFAIVHAHPPVATGFAVVGETFAEPVLPEVLVTLGPVALVPYATPGTEALAERLDPLIASHDVFLLANHGATTVGRSLAVAYERMESLEHSARILLAARLLGRVRTLTADQVRDLVAAREGAVPPAPSGSGLRQGGGLETQ